MHAINNPPASDVSNYGRVVKTDGGYRLADG